MTHEAFGEDYFKPVDKNVVNLVEQICMWSRKSYVMYPTDVLNMLIENNIITKVEVDNIVEQTNKKPLDITLPTSYISQ